MNMEEQAEYSTEPDYDIEDTARIFRVHSQTIRRLARQGKIPGAYKIGGKWLIRRSWVDKVREGDGEYA